MISPHSIAIVAGADTPNIRLTRSASSMGLAPKSRLNSRLNCEELSYPTRPAAIPARNPS